MKTIRDFLIKLVHGLPPIAKKDDRIAIDTEFFGMKKGKLHRPIGKFAWLGATFDGETVYYISDESQIQDFLQRISPGVWIFHNAKFDIFHLRRFADVPKRKRIWDTMLIEKIMFSGLYSSFSLKDLSRRYLHAYMEKEVREQFSTENEMTPDMILYAVYDVIATFWIYKKQREIISPTDLDIWKSIDREILWLILNMNGMMLDIEAWKNLAEENEKIVNEIQRKYPGINLASSKQVGNALVSRGVNLPRTDKGNLQTGRKVLEKLASEDEFITDKLRFSEAKKLASTYGMNFINEYVEQDGRVYSDFIINGAATSRFSSQSPNLENIPKRQGIKYRQCFIAGQGNVLISLDYSSQEPRIGAYFTQDPLLIQIFQERKDLYIEAAKLMFGWEIDKKDPRRNSRMKPVVLGAFYGLSEWGLEREYGIPRDEGKKLLNTFFETFPKVHDWIKKQQRKTDYVETALGRKFWLNPYLDSGKALRNSINSPIQGTASDMIKRAGLRIQDWYGWEHKIVVNWIHDEIVLEVPQNRGEEVLEKAKEIMIQTAEEIHKGIPADVEGYINTRWVKP